ncbi:baculoviral IAP repeat-containing protein 5-like [Lycorma delicatula]|uniref:baculoviral IAP repeat-containing protein 5-like n=1 Tax=Lycorma delicatula TaxID=130591 RepID=UPI003F50DC27
MTAVPAVLKPSAKMIWLKERLSTLSKWPYPDSAPCSARKLAETGFFSLQLEDEPDLAACFVCLKQMYWEKNDDPKAEHASHSPDCLFVKINKKEEDLTVSEFMDLYRESIINYKKMYMNEVLNKLRTQRNEFSELGNTKSR